MELLCPIIDVSELDSSSSGGSGYSITIGNAAKILGDCNIGDSIAVNGEIPSSYLSEAMKLTIRSLLNRRLLDSDGILAD